MSDQAWINWLWKAFWQLVLSAMYYKRLKHFFILNSKGKPMASHVSNTDYLKDLQRFSLVRFHWIELSPLIMHLVTAIWGTTNSERQNAKCIHRLEVKCKRSLPNGSYDSVWWVNKTHLCLVMWEQCFCLSVLSIHYQNSYSHRLQSSIYFSWNITCAFCNSQSSLWSGIDIKIFLRLYLHIGT